jgi:hypothetical protein
MYWRRIRVEAALFGRLPAYFDQNTSACLCRQIKTNEYGRATKVIASEEIKKDNP